MTLEEDEDIDLNPALWASGQQASGEKRSPAKAQRALTRCAEFATAIPIIILLLPVYTLIQLCAAAARIHRILREQIHRHAILPDMRIPDVCSGPGDFKAR